METVNVSQTKTHFSRLLKRVEAGEEITVTRNGKAVARLVPVGRVARRPGAMKGRIRMSRDFDAPFPAKIRGAFLA